MSREQRILSERNGYKDLDEYIKEKQIKRVFLVCGNSVFGLEIGEYFRRLPDRLGVDVVRFGDFQPNPEYESVVQGTSILRSQCCDMIAAVGGGSAIDVAKCIKLFAGADEAKDYMKQEIIPNSIPFLAVPTTAGTGSEATEFAVIYRNGEKVSIAHESCLPRTVLFDAALLRTLSPYQKSATMMDALCHAVESYWSVFSTQESKKYASQALSLFFDNYKGYLDNGLSESESMQQMANLAGKAINISKTTAGHAMCYKLTTMYGIAHGHAAALCVEALWKDMETMKCIDPRGTEYFERTMNELAKKMGCSGVHESAQRFSDILNSLPFHRIEEHDEKNYRLLRASVNAERLKNFPCALNEMQIDCLYRRILHAKDATNRKRKES